MDTTSLAFYGAGADSLGAYGHSKDVARRTELDLLDEELGLAPRALDKQRCQRRFVLEHKAADDDTAALADAEDVF